MAAIRKTLSDRLGNTVREPMIIIGTERGDGEFALTLAQSDRFKARFFFEDPRNFTDHARFSIIFHCVTIWVA
jgi:hypothetical protein